MSKFILLWVATIGLAAACKPHIRTETEFYRWINDPENGFVQSKKANDLRITVKYLPATFLAYKEWRNIPRAGKKEMDSLLHFYQRSYTFLMTIKPDAAQTDVGTRASGDVIYQGVGNYHEYRQRVRQLNFNLEAFFELRAGKQVIKPILSTMENTYGAAEQRNFYLVFSDTEEKTSLLAENELDLTFQDEVFDTGISHFIFQKTNIESLPAMTDLTTHLTP